jgi:hypothetical protein
MICSVEQRSVAQRAQRRYVAWPLRYFEDDTSVTASGAGAKLVLPDDSVESVPGF